MEKVCAMRACDLAKFQNFKAVQLFNSKLFSCTFTILERTILCEGVLCAIESSKCYNLKILNNF